MADKESVNETLRYHGAISGAMTAERTALESALVPVTAYIIVSAIESYRRYPELMTAISAAVPPAELGAMGRQPGNQIDAVHLWSIVNMPLIGRQVLAPFGMIDPEADLERIATVFEFWKPATLAFRGDGHLQAWDAGFVVPRYSREVIGELLAGSAPVSDEDRAGIARLNATLTSFLFLLYFDTRAGYQDTGAYPLPDGRTLLVRDFNEFGVSHFSWSAEVCAALPHSNLTFAFVLDDVEIAVNDWGTSVTNPEDAFSRVVSFGMFDSTGGTLTPVPMSSVADLTAVVKRAQKDLYRLVAGMTRYEKINAGAYVYFTFLLPFARAAGVEHELDWTVPRDSLDLYEGVATIDKLPDTVIDPSVDYYTLMQ